MKQAAIRKFSNIKSPPLKPDVIDGSGGRKKSVPGPTTPTHFLSLLMFSTFQRPMSIRPNTKAALYLCAAAAGSLIFGLVRMPATYFSNRYNLINLVFVKWGWAWTCSTISAFLIASSYVYTGANTRLMRGHILRIVTGTAFWYIVTAIFELALEWTGHCYSQQSNTLLSLQTASTGPYRRLSCKRAGGTWYGFDISGHCFLLTMGNLWILEEVKTIHYWSKLAEILQPYDNSRSDAELASSNSRLRNISSEQLKMMRSGFRRVTGTVRWTFSMVACLSIIWDFMFLVTIVYFHTLPSKLLGTAFGVGAWFLAYRVIFPGLKTGSLAGFAPGLPGDGLIDFVPRS